MSRRSKYRNISDEVDFTRRRRSERQRMFDVGSRNRQTVDHDLVVRILRQGSVEPAVIDHHVKRDNEDRIRYGGNLADRYAQQEQRVAERRDARREAKRLDREQLLANLADPRHGRLHTYNNVGCRCEPCREVARAYAIAYRERRLNELEAS